MTAAMAAGLALVVLAVLLSVGFGMALYALVRREAHAREPMDRDAAERAARRDTGGDN
ncbi:MAG: hypothetical protein ABEJ92_06275 [Halobacteriales archaeon]